MSSTHYHGNLSLMSSLILSIKKYWPLVCPHMAYNFHLKQEPKIFTRSEKSRNGHIWTFTRCMLFNWSVICCEQEFHVLIYFYFFILGMFNIRLFFWAQINIFHCKEKRNIAHLRGQQTHNHGEGNHAPTRNIDLAHFG